METLIESMTRVVLPNWGGTVRCWRQENDYSELTKSTTKGEIEAFILGPGKEYQKASRVGYEIFSLAQALLSMDRMNAVEILGDDGCGVVIYKNWP